MFGSMELAGSLSDPESVEPAAGAKERIHHGRRVFQSREIALAFQRRDHQSAVLELELDLPPAAAALLMSASTVIVASNAQLLRRQEI
jgi:hypothetical protein